MGSKWLVENKDALPLFQSKSPDKKVIFQAGTLLFSLYVNNCHQKSEFSGVTHNYGSHFADISAFRYAEPILCTA